MTVRKPQGTWAGSSYAEPRPCVIDLNVRGVGAAQARYLKLEQLLREAIVNFRQELLFDYALTISLYMKTTRWKIKDAPHWKLELEPEEWQAISRGLRDLNRPEANSMYQWLNQRKENQ